MYTYIILNVSPLSWEYMFWCILRDGIEKEESFDFQEKGYGGLQYFVSIINTGWC